MANVDASEVAGGLTAVFAANTLANGSSINGADGANTLTFNNAHNAAAAINITVNLAPTVAGSVQKLIGAKGDSTNANADSYTITSTDVTGQQVIINNSGTATDVTSGTNDFTQGSSTVTTGDGNAVIVLGAGDDTVSVGGGTNTIVTGGGADSITTGGGNSTISSGAGQDSIIVGNGTNTITGGADADTVVLGTGVNSLVYTTKVTSDTVTGFDIGTGGDESGFGLTALNAELVTSAAIVNGIGGSISAGATINFSEVIGSSGITFAANDTIFLTSATTAADVVTYLKASAFKADTVATPQDGDALVVAWVDANSDLHISLAVVDVDTTTPEDIVDATVSDLAVLNGTYTLTGLSASNFEFLT